MRKILIVSVIALSLLVLNKSPKQSINNSDMSNVGQAFKHSENPFGVMVGAPFGMQTSTKLEVAQKLGVSYYRPATAIFLDKTTKTCTECLGAKDAGLKLILTVRNGGGKGTPSQPPANDQVYSNQVTTVLTTYKPDLLVVENEENSQELFYSGTPDQYHAELKLACEQAHLYNTKCANGGLVSSLVIGLVYNDLISSGEPAKANAFLHSALSQDKLDQFTKQGSSLSEQLTRGEQLLAGYKESGADYVNFHWYSDSPTALETAKAYLERASGLPAISNEMGQQDNISPTQVTDIMQAVVDLKLPIAVWYSIDTLTHGQARGLTTRRGDLRDNGVAFQNFIYSNYSSQ